MHGAIHAQKSERTILLTGLDFAAYASSALLFVALSFGLGCSPLENQARDLAATSQGVIRKAQEEYGVECKGNPTKPFPCVTINQAIGAQNTLIDVLETYCAWTARPTAEELAAQSGKPCARLKSTSAALSMAVRNLDVVMADLQRTSGGVK